MTQNDMTLDSVTVDTTRARHKGHHHHLLAIDKAAGPTAKPYRARAREAFKIATASKQENERQNEWVKKL